MADALGKITDLATIGALAFGGFILLKAVGGIKGIEDLISGVAGTPASVVSGIGAAGSSFIESLTPGLTPAQIEQAKQQFTDELEASGGILPSGTGIGRVSGDQTQAVVEQLAQSGLMLSTSPLEFDASGNAIPKSGYAATLLKNAQPTTPLKAAPGNVDYERVNRQKADPVNAYYAGEITIQQMHAYLERQANPSQSGGLVVSQPSGSTATVEQNKALVERIREEQGNAAADNAAMFLRL